MSGLLMAKSMKNNVNDEGEWLFGLHAVQSVLKTSGSKIVNSTVLTVKVPLIGDPTKVIASSSAHRSA